MASIFIRTIIIYITLSLTFRLTGKRQVSELEVSELICTFLISEIAAFPIDDPDIPLLNAVIPIIFIMSVEIILSHLKNKFRPIEKLFEGKSDYIIYRGHFFQKVLKENRISVREFFSEIRNQGYGGIGELYYAILEPNGRISLIEKQDQSKKNSGQDKGISHPIIIDGKIDEAALGHTGLDKTWVRNQMTAKNCDVSEVFLFAVNDAGETELILKEKE